MDRPQRITNAEMVMLRVVIDQHYDNGRITPEAFSLTKKDGFHLSVNQESKISPADALKEKAQTIKQRKAQLGQPFNPPPVVARMTVEEIQSIPLPTEEGELHDSSTSALSIWDDSMTEGVPESHAFLDFEQTYSPRKRRKAVYNRLAAISNDNGKLFRPSN